VSIRVFSWPKKIMPPRHQDTKVHKEYFSCLVLTFLLDFVISKKNINHLRANSCVFVAKKIMPPSHKGSKVHKEYFSCLVLTFLLDFVISKKNINHLRANSCVFVAKKNNATKTPRHKGSQRFLFLCSGDFLT